MKSLGIFFLVQKIFELKIRITLRILKQNQKYFHPLVRSPGGFYMKKLKSKILLDCPIKVVSKTGPDFKTVSDMFLNIFFKVFFSIKQCAHLSFRPELVLGRTPPPLLWLSRAEDDSSSLDAACACVELSASTSGSCLSAQMLAQKYQHNEVS